MAVHEEATAVQGAILVCESANASGSSTSNDAWGILSSVGASNPAAANGKSAVVSNSSPFAVVNDRLSYATWATGCHLCLLKLVAACCLPSVDCLPSAGVVTESGGEGRTAEGQTC